MARIALVQEGSGRHVVLPGPSFAGLGRLRKIAILGNHDSRVHTPWDDMSWEIWAHTSCKGLAKRVDRYFDLHPKCWWEAEKTWKKGYKAWLAQLKTPIFMQEAYPDVPMAIRYPKERILAEFRRYFTSQTAWMIALALTEGVTHLGFFGIAYQHFTEYATQRAGAEYWIGFAEGRGVQIVLPESTPLCQTPRRLYGYESHDVNGLHEDYKQYPKPKAEKAKPDDAKTELAMVDMEDGKAERPPLMKIPGHEPAWERSGHRFHF